MRRLLKVIIAVAILAQLSISSYYIFRWFSGIIRSYIAYYNWPKENRIFTTSLQDYKTILYIRKNLPEDANILWIPQVSPIINYYIYPRRIYQKKIFAADEEIGIDKGFLEEKKIDYVFFDHDMLYPVEEVEIISGADKDTMIRK